MPRLSWSVKALASAVGTSIVVAWTAGLACSSFTAAPSPDDAATSAPNAADATSAVDAAEVIDAADAGDPNLVAHYSFEDADGNFVRDSSGRARHGVLVGAAAFVPDGIRGRALKVGAKDGMLVEALDKGGFPPAGTLSVWFRYTLGPVDSSSRAIFDDYGGRRQHIFLRRLPSTDAGEFQVAFQRNDDSYAFDSTYTPAQVDKWTRVVVTWTSTSGAFYVDGRQIGKGGYGDPFSPVAQRFALGIGFIGSIDEVRLYDRAMTATEVAALAP